MPPRNTLAMCAPLPPACVAAAHVKWILPAWLDASVATDCSVLVLGGTDGPDGLTAISESALVVYTAKRRSCPTLKLREWVL